MAKIQFTIEDLPSFTLPQADAIAAWITQVMVQREARLKALHYIFCSDTYLHQINLTHLQHDTYTDIITFPYSYQPVHSDIFISIDRIQDNAAQLGIPFERELLRVMIHGVLHLTGCDDKTPTLKAQMRQAEDKAIELFYGQASHIDTAI